MKILSVFAAAFAAGIVFGLLMLWVVGWFVDLGLPGQGNAALTVGVTLTSGLSCALMALVFYSGRSGHDDQVRRIN